MKDIAHIEFTISRDSDAPLTQEEHDALLDVLDAEAAGLSLTEGLSEALKGTDAPKGRYIVEVNARVRKPETGAPSEKPGVAGLRVVGGTDTKH